MIREMFIERKGARKDVTSFFISKIILLGFSFLFCESSLSQESVTGEQLFLKRCAICHDLPKPEAIPEEGWIKNMDVMAPLARLRKNQKKDVLQYLVSHSNSQSITSLQKEDKLLMERKCSHCHSLDRVFEKVNEASQPDLFSHIAKQMQEKSPQWLSDEEARLISNYLDTRINNERLNGKVIGK